MIPTIKDPKGNDLVPILLQVMEADARGPVVLRQRFDDETVSMVDVPPESGADQVQMYMVWAPKLGGLGMFKLSRDQQRIELDQLIARVQREASTIQDNRVKTDALRELQRERDPDRVAAAVANAVEVRTATLQAEITQLKASVVERDREIAELKASKKRLKEANERLKDGKR